MKQTIMKPFAFIFTICSLFLWGCSKPKDEATLELEAYLSFNFRLRIDSGKIYCFVPANQCRNCMRYTAVNTSPKLNQKLVIISGFPSSNFEGFENVYTDSNNDMLRLRFLDYGNKFIVCKPGQQAVVIPLYNFYAQLDSIEGIGI